MRAASVILMLLWTLPVHAQSAGVARFKVILPPGAPAPTTMPARWATSMTLEALMVNADLFIRGTARLGEFQGADFSTLIVDVDEVFRGSAEKQVRFLVQLPPQPPVRTMGTGPGFPAGAMPTGAVPLGVPALFRLERRTFATTNPPPLPYYIGPMLVGDWIIPLDGTAPIYDLSLKPLITGKEIVAAARRIAVEYADVRAPVPLLSLRDFWLTLDMPLAEPTRQRALRWAVSAEFQERALAAFVLRRFPPDAESDALVQRLRDDPHYILRGRGLNLQKWYLVRTLARERIDPTERSDYFARRERMDAPEPLHTPLTAAWWGAGLLILFALLFHSTSRRWSSVHPVTWPRHLARFTTFLCIAVLLLTAWFWWRSRTTFDEVVLRLGGEYYIATANHRLRIVRLPHPLGQSSLRVGSTEWSEFLRFYWLAGDPRSLTPRPKWLTTSQLPVEKIPFIRLEFPLWLPVLLLLIPPALTTRHTLRQRRRLRNHLCLNCGYDLRETKGRCPECGQAIDQVAVSSAHPTQVIDERAAPRARSDRHS